MVKEKNSTLLRNLIITFVIAFVSYFYVMKPPASETYKIKSSGAESGYKASFINTTGKDAEDKKIELSDDYLSSGKFK